MTAAPKLRILRVLRVLVAREISLVLHYRWWLAMMQLSNIIAPAISLLVWRGAIAQGATPPVSESFLTTYLVLVSLVSMLTSSWTSGFLAAGIRLGELNSWLVRPCSTHVNGLANNVAEKLMKLTLLAPLAVALGLLFRDKVALPPPGLRWIAFLVALFMAAGMTFALDVVIGSLAFWFEDVSAIDRLRQLLARTLSGALIPLALFPAAFSGFLTAQPFRFMVSFPLEVLLGRPSDESYLLAVGWFTTFLGAAVVIWRIGLRNYQGAGA
ncbi:ABC-2 family transporter protein [Kribbella sp. VKM Ac-2568]|uniref:ABC transporter permease n=1 Tax=Kribbella sp. VKM Ac-2568 TaxID=2512219 RepID=UPI001048C4CC|nr:ABC-2 family transporter protein [Kribbella sp. VKM Ac-2568]TCM45218.1 ABC-2 type transport system permease protein [Kribbella sp. VKM Ac-2568]